MRTTMNVSEDVLYAARSLATAKGISLGDAVSELARRGLKATSVSAESEFVPVFSVSEGTPLFGPEDVAKAEEEQ
jgi:hypothetical protein